MWESLQQFKQQFLDECVICPGHDYGDRPEATLGDQKRSNPALAHARYEAFEKEWFLTEYSSDGDGARNDGDGAGRAG